MWINSVRQTQLIVQRTLYFDVMVALLEAGMTEKVWMATHGLDGLDTAALVREEIGQFAWFHKQWNSIEIMDTMIRQRMKDKSVNLNVFLFPRRAFAVLKFTHPQRIFYHYTGRTDQESGYALGPLVMYRLNGVPCFAMPDFDFDNGMTKHSTMNRKPIIGQFHFAGDHLADGEQKNRCAADRTIKIYDQNLDRMVEISLLKLNEHCLRWDKAGELDQTHWRVAREPNARDVFLRQDQNREMKVCEHWGELEEKNLGDNEVKNVIRSVKTHITKEDDASITTLWNMQKSMATHAHVTDNVRNAIKRVIVAIAEGKDQGGVMSVIMHPDNFGVGPIGTANIKNNPLFASFAGLLIISQNDPKDPFVAAVKDGLDAWTRFTNACAAIFTKESLVLGDENAPLTQKPWIQERYMEANLWEHTVCVGSPKVPLFVGRRPAKSSFNFVAPHQPTSKLVGTGDRKAFDTVHEYLSKTHKSGYEGKRYSLARVKTSADMDEVQRVLKTLKHVREDVMVMVDHDPSLVSRDKYAYALVAYTSAILYLDSYVEALNVAEGDAEKAEALNDFEIAISQLLTVVRETRSDFGIAPLDQQLDTIKTVCTLFASGADNRLRGYAQHAAFPELADALDAVEDADSRPDPVAFKKAHDDLNTLFASERVQKNPVLLAATDAYSMLHYRLEFVATYDATGAAANRGADARVSPFVLPASYVRYRNSFSEVLVLTTMGADNESSNTAWTQGGDPSQVFLLLGDPKWGYARPLVPRAGYDLVAGIKKALAAPLYPRRPRSRGEAVGRGANAAQSMLGASSSNNPNARRDAFAVASKKGPSAAPAPKPDAKAADSIDNIDINSPFHFSAISQLKSRHERFLERTECVVSRAIAGCFLFTPINKRTLDSVIRSGSTFVPAQYYIFRPFNMQEMAGIIAMEGGAGTCEMLWKNANVQVGHDVNVKTIYVHTTFYSSCAIYKEDNIVKQENVLYVRYCGGLNTRFFDEEQLRQLRKHKFIPSTDVNRPSCISVLVAPTERCNRKRIDLKGVEVKRNNAMRTQTEKETDIPSDYGSKDYYGAKALFADANMPPHGLLHLSKPTQSNSVMFQGHTQLWTPDGTYSNYILEQGHHGPHVGNGCAAIRDGELVPPPRFAFVSAAAC